MVTKGNKQVHSLADEGMKEFYMERGFAGTAGFGKRPAVLVIDLAKAWTDPSSPIGTDLSGVIEQTMRVLRVARRKGVPVFFTTMAFEADLRDCGEVVMKKSPSSGS